MDKSLLYKSGDIFLPTKIRDFLETHIIGSYKDSIYVTYWSIFHFMMGIISGWIYLMFGYSSKYYFKAMFFLHTIWELWQVFIGMSKPNKHKGKNNRYDILLDTIFFMIGTYLAFYIFGVVQ